MFRRTLLTTLLTASALVACKKDPPPPPPPAPKPTSAPAPTEAPEAARAADPGCAGKYTEEGEAKVFEAGGKSFSLKGARLDETSKDADDQLVLGVVADINEDTPDNLANLDAIIKFFKDGKAEGVIIDGDLGEDQKQIEAVLSKLTESGLPLFAIAGNRDGRAAFNDAVAAVAARYPGLFNLNQIRAVLFDDGALVTMPGYHNKLYIHAEDGCAYGPADLEATKPAIAAAAGKTVVFVSHGPPKQDGADALDRTLEHVNVGDPAMAELLKASAIKFGIFANVREAGGRATNLAGTTLVKEGTLADELYLTTGAADAVRWQMNDGTESNGMATLFTLKGKQASFKVFRAPAKKVAK